MFDIIVIGGSLSGASLALLLGRAGFRVLVTEKGSFPKSRPCGEGLSSTGLEIAQHLKLLPPKNLPYQPFSGFALYSGEHSATLSHPYSTGISVERSYLDSHLLGSLSNLRGVEVRERCRVTALSRENENYCNVTVEGERAPLAAKAVVVAAGGTSTLLRKISHVTHQTRAFRVGVSGHFAGDVIPLIGKIHIFLRDGIELYVTPLNDNKVNIALLTHSDNSGQLKELLAQAPKEIERRFGVVLKASSDSRSHGRTHLGNIARSGRGSGIFLVGDAIEQFDPIGGMGMTHAFFSAGLASECIARGIIGQISISDALAQYEHSRLSFARTLRWFTTFTAGAVKVAARYPPAVHLASSTIARCISATMSPKYKNSRIQHLSVPTEPTITNSQIASEL